MQIAKSFTMTLAPKLEQLKRQECVPIEDQINGYLRDNPTHVAKCIAVNVTGFTKEATVIFDIREPKNK